MMISAPENLQDKRRVRKRPRRMIDKPRERKFFFLLTLLLLLMGLLSKVVDHLLLTSGRIMP